MVIVSPDFVCARQVGVFEIPRRFDITESHMFSKAALISPTVLAITDAFTQVLLVLEIRVFPRIETWVPKW